MVWIASLETAFLICNRNASMGTAAKGTTVADSIWKLRSGTGTSTDRLGFRFQLCEATTDLRPDFSASRKTFPVGANQANEFVALIDGGNVVLSPSQAMRMSYAVDEQGLDVGAEVME